MFSQSYGTLAIVSWGTSPGSTLFLFPLLCLCYFCFLWCVCLLWTPSFMMMYFPSSFPLMWKQGAPCGRPLMQVGSLGDFLLAKMFSFDLSVLPDEHSRLGLCLGFSFALFSFGYAKLQSCSQQYQSIKESSRCLSRSGPAHALASSHQLCVWLGILLPSCSFLGVTAQRSRESSVTPHSCVASDLFACHC